MAMHESKYLHMNLYVGITYFGIYFYTNKQKTSHKFGNSGGKFKSKYK